MCSYGRFVAAFAVEWDDSEAVTSALFDADLLFTMGSTEEDSQGDNKAIVYTAPEEREKATRIADEHAIVVPAIGPPTPFYKT